MYTDIVPLEQEKNIDENFKALDIMSNLATGMEFLAFTLNNNTSTNIDVLNIATESLYDVYNVPYKKLVSLESFKDKPIQIWQSIVNVIMSIKKTIADWIKSLLIRVGFIQNKCDNLVKEIDKIKDTSTEDYSGSRFDSTGAIRFKSITVDVREPDGFMYKGELVGLNEDGINGVREAITNNSMNSVIMDKGNDICDLLNTSTIRERDDYLEFKEEFDNLIREFNDGVMSRTNISNDYVDEPVYEIALTNFPGNAKYLITKESDVMPVTVEFIGGGSDGKKCGGVKAPAMDHKATKSFALLVGATCGDIIIAQRELNKVTALDDKVIMAGKQLLKRMTNTVYDDTDYQTGMTANFSALNKLGVSSRKAYVGLIRNSTRVLSGAYLYAADCYRNLILN